MKHKWFIKNIEEIIAGIALIIVILSVSYGVLSRYIFKSSAPWANEIATAGFVWVVFIGASSAFKSNMHIGIDLLIKKAPPKIGVFLALLSDILVLMFVLYATYLSIKISISAFDKLTAVLRIPYTYIDMASVIGFGSISIHHLINMSKKIRDKKYIR